MTLSKIWDLVQTHGWTAVAVLAFLGGIIEISPIKINPWSAIADWIGKALTKSLAADLKDIREKQGEIRSKLEKHIAMDDERDAEMRKQRILRFNAELIRGDNFSVEYFREILAEIDAYEEYCSSHEDYKNGRAVMAIENIKRECRHHEERHDFLED